MFFLDLFLQRGSDELLNQAAVMAPASDNNNQDLASKKAKLEPSTVLGGVGKFSFFFYYIELRWFLMVEIVVNTVIIFQLHIHRKT